jgi:hypothetical protein
LLEVTNTYPQVPIEWGLSFAYQGNVDDYKDGVDDLPILVQSEARKRKKVYFRNDDGVECMWGYPTWTWIRKLWSVAASAQMRISLHLNNKDGLKEEHGRYVAAILTRERWIWEFIKVWSCNVFKGSNMDRAPGPEMYGNIFKIVSGTYEQEFQTNMCLFGLDLGREP